MDVQMANDQILTKLFFPLERISPGSGAIKAVSLMSRSNFSSIFSITESEIEIKSETVSLLWAQSQVLQMSTPRLRLLHHENKCGHIFNCLGGWLFGSLSFQQFLTHGCYLNERTNDFVV